MSRRVRLRQERLGTISFRRRSRLVEHHQPPSAAAASALNSNGEQMKVTERGKEKMKKDWKGVKEGAHKESRRKERCMDGGGQGGKVSCEFLALKEAGSKEGVSSRGG
ncbi:hypothetical protein EYF80_043277 [Liparis tanakae]|uniref:Uncharacterized protein n=1 Tax=Liparis tanakae TaxID=230148 RepID=A0A4Z2G0U0_9TELE|nr:hypothetical protein EYF80_043277 [Liparis tanakae]